MNRKKQTARNNTGRLRVYQGVMPLCGYRISVLGLFQQDKDLAFGLQNGMDVGLPDYLRFRLFLISVILLE
ncbi:hypothetical protein PACILC2_16630 [Paenibacillus cisolokensis]|uniref:Uncharacterized protein n=1 Tax=Paenibacillus cisolokensis TaxID=1658519 RepID=A0ABQ4N4K1_9BACL|nr:hypothetical protein PACILC2_16630 [Paenibacillus cisolokensis]